MSSDRGLLVSFEGISGTGKTFLSNLVRPQLQHLSPVYVSELSDRNQASPVKQILDILKSGGRLFRMPTPATATHLLIALKAYDYETIIGPALEQGAVVIEDRSLDTIAIYQSILLNHEPLLDSASDIFWAASKWRRIPDITFLFEDDFTVAISRAELRNGDSYSKDEMDLLAAAARLYVGHAERHSDRFVRLDRRILDNEQLSLNIVRAIVERLRAQS